MNNNELQKIVSCVVATLQATEEKQKAKEEPRPATRSRRRRQSNTPPAGENASAKGLQPGWERVTLTAQIHWINKLRDYAYTERLTLKEATDRMMESFLADKVVQRDPNRE